MAKLFYYAVNNAVNDVAHTITTSICEWHVITNVINVINNKIMTFELVISGIFLRCGHFKDINNIIKGII